MKTLLLEMSARLHSLTGLSGLGDEALEREDFLGVVFALRGHSQELIPAKGP